MFYDFQSVFYILHLALISSIQWQGSHRVWKTWKTWKIKFPGKVMESHGTLKNHQKSWKSHGTSHTDKSSPSIRNLALISFASHLVSCIHSNTSDYQLSGEIEANPLVYCY